MQAAGRSLAEAICDQPGHVSQLRLADRGREQDRIRVGDRLQRGTRVTRAVEYVEVLERLRPSVRRSTG
jgi:hypothetical protein